MYVPLPLRTILRCHPRPVTMGYDNHANPNKTAYNLVDWCHTLIWPPLAFFQTTPILDNKFVHVGGSRIYVIHVIATSVAEDLLHCQFTLNILLFPYAQQSHCLIGGFKLHEQCL